MTVEEIVAQAIAAVRNIPGPNIQRFHEYLASQRLSTGGVVGGHRFVRDLIRAGILRVDLNYLLLTAALAAIDKRQAWRVYPKDGKGVAERTKKIETVILPTKRDWELYIEQRAI